MSNEQYSNITNLSNAFCYAFRIIACTSDVLCSSSNVIIDALPPCQYQKISYKYFHHFLFLINFKKILNHFKKSFTYNSFFFNIYCSYVIKSFKSFMLHQSVIESTTTTAIVTTPPSSSAGKIAALVLLLIFLFVIIILAMILIYCFKVNRKRPYNGYSIS